MKSARFLLVATPLVVSLFSCATAPNGAQRPPASVPATESYAGDWMGEILVGAQTIQITIHFSGKDRLVGTIDIPQQAAIGLPLEEIVVAGNTISFSLNAGSDVARFSGTAAGPRIAGRFAQGPAVGTFELVAGTAASVGAAAGPSGSGGRLTTPPGATNGRGAASGAPGSSQIELRTDTGVVVGTLTLPDGQGPWPIALIIAGSGPTDRDGNSPLLPGKNDSLKMIAQVLRSVGIASVRYDKRGVGQSASAKISEEGLRFDTFVGDAVSWVRLLRQDGRFGKLVIVGHSEGALIGMLAASRAGADAFVSIAGAGAPLDIVLKQQFAAQPSAISGEAYRIIDSLRAGRLVDKVSDALLPVFRPSVQRFLMSEFQYDPTSAIASLRVPVLIVQGTTDLQISVDDAKRLSKASPGSQLAIIDGMNHVLKIAPPDREKNLAAYSDPSLPLAPGLVTALENFLGRTAR